MSGKQPVVHSCGVRLFHDEWDGSWWYVNPSGQIKHVGMSHHDRCPSCGQRLYISETKPDTADQLHLF